MQLNHSCDVCVNFTKFSSTDVRKKTMKLDLRLKITKKDEKSMNVFTHFVFFLKHNDENIQLFSHFFLIDHLFPANECFL